MEQLTALQYQQCLMSLPNPERFKYPLNKIRVAYIRHQGGKRRLEYDLQANEPHLPIKMGEIQELEFELNFDTPVPYWQPTSPIQIIPIKRT